MARRHIQGNSEYFEADVAVVSGPPFTVSTWANPTVSNSEQALVYIGEKASATDMYSLFLSSGAELIARTRGSVGITDSSGITFVTGTWQHCLGIWASTSSRQAALDAVEDIAETTSNTGIVTDRTAIGRNGDSSPSQYMSGAIGETCVWDVVLSVGERAALARGVRACRIRPASIKAYWPQFPVSGDAIDYSNSGLTLVEFNTVGVENDPPFTLFTPKWAASAPLIETAAPAGFAHSQAVVMG